MSCYQCDGYVPESEAIACCGCKKWAHKKCVFMSKVPKADLAIVNWVCNPCLAKLKFYLDNGEAVNNLVKLNVSLDNKIKDMDVFSRHSLLLHPLIRSHPKEKFTCC